MDPVSEQEIAQQAIIPRTVNASRPKSSRTFLTLFITVLLVVVGGLSYYVYGQKAPSQNGTTPTPTSAITALVSPKEQVAGPLPTIPPRKIMPSDYQVFQTFNNCGPASLSMALSFFGIHKTQAELGQDIRPYQNSAGDNDDKSSTLDELALEAEKFGLVAYARPHGNIQLLEQLVAQDFPVIIETTLHLADDIGHYRVVKGYDSAMQMLIQDDSFEGHNLYYSYADINTMWKMYDNAYVVLVPKSKQKIAEQILGKDLDIKTAWREAADVNREALSKNPDDVYARFNLSVALYYLGDYSGSVEEFEKVQSKLPFRTLWYQIEPIQSYYMLGRYDKVFQITDQILNTGNRAFSELYLIRGDIYKKQGNKQAAKSEYEKAVFYNVGMKAAKDALASVE